MRAWSVFRQLLAATLCVALVAPAYPSEGTLPLSGSTPSHTYDAATLSKTRVWGSNEKILLHFRATRQLSGKQRWGCEERSEKVAIGSVVTYDYDAFGNLIHSTTTLASPTPNNYLFAGEQFDPDLNLYYNRARYLNVSTGRFWTTDSFEGNYGLPPSLHKYVYSDNDAVNFVDPSGKLISTIAYGQAVHDAIGADFELKVPGGIYNNSVKSILGIKVPGLSLRPDLTDTLNHLGYEIKPAGSAAQGAAQLAGYLFALTLFDPNKNVWLPGELYLPPPLMLLNAHAVALISPPIAGVIIYEVIDEIEITGIVAAATAALGADLAGSFAVATLVEAY